VTGPLYGANGAPSRLSSTATPGSAVIAKVGSSVYQPSLCVPTTVGVTPVPVAGGAGTPTKLSALFVETATLPPASTAWTKYSTRVAVEAPGRAAAPVHVAPDALARSTKLHTAADDSR
jgi:hypothetical protein